MKLINGLLKLIKLYIDIKDLKLRGDNEIKKEGGVNMIRKKKKGFTIIELIIVLAIIAILSAITIPKFGDIRENANKKSDIANAKTIATVTTSLIADGEITPEKSGKLTINLNAKEDSKAEKIRNYLQVVPKLSNKDGDFTISIETNGNVSVSSSVDKEPLFPDKAE